MNIRLGDNVRIKTGRHKGEVFTVEKMDTNSMGVTWLYLTRGQIVIFRTTKQVDLEK